jgi:PBP1b-binding outer membrane lipoprotein LpoB
MKRAVILIVLFALVLSGCASKATESAATVGRNAADYEMEAPMEEAAMAADYAGQAAGISSSDATPRRLVIQNANMSIVVVKPLDAMNRIATMATEFNGFVVSSSTYTVTTRQGEDAIEANITIRVDSAQLSTVMERIRALTPDAEEDVLSESISGQDVTKDYVDLESRLRNLQDTETQLQKIMDEATKTEDVLSVYRELSSIREEIEVVTGQMKYYEESAALSSISVYIQAVEAVQPIQVGSWKPVGTARDAVQALLDTLQFLAKAAIWIIIYLLPVVLVIGLPIWLIVRGIRKARRNARARKLQGTPVEPGKPE